MSFEIKNRHRIRRKDALYVAKELGNIFNTSVVDNNLPLDLAEVGPRHVYIQQEMIVAIEFGDRMIPSIRALLSNPPTSKFVTVDMGAVPFVTNGASVMAPGIVDADKSIVVGDLIWVRDEKHQKALAIGETMYSGVEMLEMIKGKVVKVIHYVGDDMWSVV